MKVAMVTRYFGLENGGIGQVSQQLARRISRIDGVDVWPIYTMNKGRVGYFRYTLIDLYREFAQLPDDIAVYHCLTPMETFWAPKSRTVVTVHDLIPMLHLSRIRTHYVNDGALSGISRKISKEYFRAAIKSAARCRAMVCVSEETAGELLDATGVESDKVTVIRSGISPSLEPRNRAGGDKLIVGTLSWLDHRKRIDKLIRAFRLTTRKDAELWIAGNDGPASPELKKLAAGDERIKFLGFVPDDDMVDFFQRLDLFVFPTKVEGYGLPIAEAMACARPVVTFRDAIIPHDLKDKTDVVRDEAELAGAIQYWEIHEPTSYSLRLAEWSKFEHNWEMAAQRYFNVYRAVATAEGVKGGYVRLGR